MYRLAVPVLLVFFLMLILALTLGQSLWVAQQIVKIDDCSGRVEVRVKGERGWSRLEKGATIKKGDYVRTWRGGHAVLTWVDGTRLMPEENTIFEVRECSINSRKQSTQSVFHLVQGKVWLRVRTKVNADAGSRFEVSTPHLTASVHGTTFSVTSTPTESSVSVREGRVKVTPSAGQRKKTVDVEGVEVQQGEFARVAKTDNVVREKMTPDEVETWQKQAAMLQPYLKVSRPLPRLPLSRTTTTVRGVTDAGCAVTVNDAPVTVEQDGTFSTTVSLVPGKQVLTVVSTSPDGLTTTVSREVICQPRHNGGK